MQAIQSSDPNQISILQICQYHGIYVKQLNLIIQQKSASSLNISLPQHVSLLYGGSERTILSMTMYREWRNN